MTTQLPSLERMAQLLGGDVRSGEVLCPGPGHSADDRSLAVKPVASDSEGFVVKSFSGDDWKDCRAHVRKLLELPERADDDERLGEAGGRKPKSTKPKPAGDGKWKTLAQFIYRDQNGAPYLRVNKCINPKGRREFPQFHWQDGNWVKGAPAPKLPYRLPELITAPLAATVYFCEGEKDADTLTKLGFVATTVSEGSSAPWDAALTPYFKDRHVVILVDADKPGRAYGQMVARAIDDVAASLRILDLYPERDDGSDVSDWIMDDTAGAKLAQMAKEAPLWEPAADKASTIASDEKLILELAGLSKLQYAKRRKDAADEIGIGVGDLDKIVADTRGDAKGKGPAPALYEHWKVEPADAAVVAAELLRDVKAALRRYVFMSEEQLLVVALWIMFSWLHECTIVVTHSAILLVMSPERDSGKTTLLGTVNFLAYRPVQTVDISGAALFRSITKWEPTIIVDEADDALAENPDLRSVINSGWTRGQGTIRCHPDTHEPELFSTFAPKVVAMKGRNLPDTSLSRSIVIEMRPAKARDPKEKVEDFDHCDKEEFAGLRSRLLRWASDNDSIEALAKITPQVPDGFHNRRRANWVPLLRIAEMCGCAEAARKAAQAIENLTATFDASVGVELLWTIKAVFEGQAKDKDNKNADRISSARLVKLLTGDPTARWVAYGERRKPITQREVAELLKPHGIVSKNIRFEDGTKDGRVLKGYDLKMLTEAFDRFCSGSSPVSVRYTATDLFSQDFPQKSSATDIPDVADKNGAKSLENNDCYIVAAENGGLGQEGYIGPSDDGADTSSESSSDLPPDLPPEPPPLEPCARCGGIDGDVCESKGYSHATKFDALGAPLDAPTAFLHPDCAADYWAGWSRQAGQAGAPGTIASVPFMITRAMKDRLRALGLADADIAGLTPQQAHELLAEPAPTSDCITVVEPAAPIVPADRLMSDYEMRDLTRFYREGHYRLTQEQGTTDPDCRPLNAQLRQRIAERGVPPDRIEEAFVRIIDMVLSDG
jgi:hypothetical protein